MSVETPPRKSYIPPKNSVNCGGHIFGPFDKFPMEAPVPEIRLEKFMGMLDFLGLDRAVITQGSKALTDNSCLYDGLERTKGRTRGVASFPIKDLTDAEFARLEALGIRGIRVFGNNGSAAPQLDGIEAVADRLRGTPWHIECSFSKAITDYTVLRPRLEKLKMPLVFSSIGNTDQSKGIDDPSFQSLLGMVRDGYAHVKLTLPSGSQPPHAETVPYARALVAANPKQLFFAIGGAHRKDSLANVRPAQASLFEVFDQWVPDDATKEQILVHNPAAFYRF